MIWRLPSEGIEEIEKSTFDRARTIAVAETDAEKLWMKTVQDFCNKQRMNFSDTYIPEGADKTKEGM